MPRSIFSKKDSLISTHMIPTSATTLNSTNGWFANGTIINNNFGGITTSNSFTSFTYNSNYEYKDDGLCDRCGKDISRIPWNKAIHYNLCKECDIHISRKIIPWK